MAEQERQEIERMLFPNDWPIDSEQDMQELLPAKAWINE